MEVRPAVPGDAEAIARVHVATWQAAYRGLLPDAFLDGLRWEDRLARWTAALSTPGPTEGGAWVAVENGTEIRGFVEWGPARDEDLGAAGNEVYAIYVAPTAWRSGVGAALLGVVPTSRDAVLWVLAGNVRALAFYRRHGFDLDGMARRREIGGAEASERRMRRSGDDG
ncbi:MAG: GNAT family N-acetyltransferase [Actinobacteria bacterium]|nr:GNAT family N-acetyltransferase [Actinomycetota bacterium]